MMAPMPSKSPAKRPAFMLSVAAESESSSPTTSSPPSTDAPKSQCSSLSDGESFEGFGDAPEGSGGVDLELTPQLNSTRNDDRSNISRHAWARTSLRRTPTHSHETLPNRRWGSMRHSSGRRHLGSNALASQLYRSSSFNSSGRSSNCDPTEDMYSDVSLDDVQDINHKLELLQRQVADTQRQVADTQNNVDDRTLRTKTDYAVLQARYHMLEEQHRDLELRYEEKLAEEQKRNKEIIARVEREAHLQNENCQIRIKTAEIEVNSLRDELQRIRTQCDKQATELEATNEKLQMARDNIVSMQEEVYAAKMNEKIYMEEKLSAEDLMVELGKECERLRAESGPAMPNTSVETIRLEELHAELEDLRSKNKSLEEQNEELQALVLTRGVEEGRNLLNGTSNSLAHELHEMNENQNSVDSATLASLTQLQSAYQDKEEENQRLKHYIDTILLNIVENYPQLLEVKSTHSESIK